MHKYNLGFISDEDIYEHVRNTVESYCRKINLKDFNENIVKYANKDWTVSSQGFDVVNNKLHIFIDMQNMSVPSWKKYAKMQSKLLEDEYAVCYYVVNNLTLNSDYVWRLIVDNKQYSNQRIHIVSIDKYYEMLFEEKGAYHKLSKSLSYVLGDILRDTDKIFS